MPWSPRVGVRALLLLALVSGSSRPVRAAGISAEFDSCGVDTSLASPQTTSVDFHPYKVPDLVSRLARRDLEFLWSDSYATLFGRALDSPRAGSDSTDLDLLGLTLTETVSANAFAFPSTYIRLMYDYLRAPGFGRPASVDNYNTDPNAEMGFAVGQPAYGDLDRNHIDTYIFAPRFSGDPLWQGGGPYAGDAPRQTARYPSFFGDADEDVSSGHPALLDSVKFLNSISIPGPRPSQVGVGGTNDWTHPRSLAPIVFNHEFQHAVNFASPSPPVTEILSHAAEALTGDHPEVPVFDVPYTWGLLTPRLNYQAYRSLSGYLTYNFRGTDTTFAGRGDDLVWRWARSADRSVAPGLGQQLVTANCAECETRTYFAGLSANDRLQLLVHNWRVANFLNNPAIADSQFYFPPQFGFDPITDVGNWQNLDTSPEAHDSVVVEREVRLTTAHLLSEETWALTPANVLNPAYTHNMALEEFGSDYWVIRSDAGLWAADRDLEIRIAPEGECTVRLLATAVAYGQQDSAGMSVPLHRHPEWAQHAVGTEWSEVGASGVGRGGDFDLVVPGFGLSHKAVLVVVTTGSTSPSTPGQVLPYRLTLALRGAPALSSNPLAITSPADAFFGYMPVWAPAGDSLAFVAKVAGSAPDLIATRRLSGGAALTLVQPLQSKNQFHPDWSPRGDWVAFDQESTSNNCDVLAYNTVTGQLRRLATSADHEFWPTFSPNGQRLSYIRSRGFAGQELRTVDIDGSDDVVVVGANGTPLQSPRWSPDGRHIFFVSGDSLYAVELDGHEVIHVPKIEARLESFDLPLGTGRILAGERWVPLNCGSPGPAQRNRVALRDTLTLATQLAFWHSSSSFLDPRWSWDGIRIAFASNLARTGVDGDIYAGQLAYNRAPTFASLGDQGLTEGVAFQLTLTATDPDGQSLTYACPSAFWPPGASFDTGTRTFLWPNPSPAGAEYFVVFRALDPSGGVANRVVKYTVQSPGGGCPFVDTRATAGWQEENSVLARSLTGSLAIDAYRLKFTPELNDGHIALRLRENEQEYTTLDQVRLVAVDHAPDVRAYALGDRVFLANRVPAHRVTTSSGRDITALVSGSGGYHWGSPGDTLFVEMTAPAVRGTFGATATQDGGGGEGGMEGDPKEMEVVYGDFRARGASPMNASAVDAAVLGSTGILVEVPDGSGGWRMLTHHYPRRYRDEAVVDSLGSGTCRLIFVGRHRLHFVGRYLRSATAAAPQTLTLLDARHSRLGDVKGAVSRSAGASTRLTPGDTLALEFAANIVPSGQVRDYFLLTTGVYSSAAPLDRQPGDETEAAAVPTRFALLQNRPNPFARTTLVHFELPIESPVKLEVFDPQGRSVVVLAEGVLPAGFHAVEWDRRDARGTLARPGVYLYRLTAGEFRETRKLLLSR